MTTTALAAPDPDPSGSAAIRALAERLAALDSRLTAVEHVPSLGLSSMEGGAIDGYTESGQLTTRTGQQHDGTSTSASLAGPTPPTPTTPIAEGAPGMASIAWDGGWLAGALTPMDYSRVEVYVSDTHISDPLPQYLTGTIETPQGAEIVTRRAAGTYYVRLASRSLSGKVSALSDEVSVEVLDLVDTDAIEAELARKTTITRSTDEPDEDGTAVGDLWWQVDEDETVIFQWRWDGETWTPLPINGLLIAAETIAAMQIAAASITGDRLLADSITTRELAALAVTAANIAANTITSNEVAAGSLTADRIALGLLQTNRVRNGGFEDTGQTFPTPGSRTAVPGWTGSNQTNGGGWAFEYNVSIAAARGSGKVALNNSGAGEDGATAHSDLFPVTPGETLKVGATVGTGTAGTPRILIWLGYYDSTGTFVSSQNVYYAGGLNSSYNEYSGTSVVPSGATSARVRLQHRGMVGITAPTWMFFDDVYVIPIGRACTEITPASITMWNSAGVRTIELNGQTATITSGTVRTAASGKRVQIDGTDNDRIKWYSGDTAEIEPGHIAVGVSTPAEGGTGRRRGQVILQPPMVRTPTGDPISLTLSSESVDGAVSSSLDIISPGGAWLNGVRLVAHQPGPTAARTSGGTFASGSMAAILAVVLPATAPVGYYDIDWFGLIGSSAAGATAYLRGTAGSTNLTSDAAATVASANGVVAITVPTRYYHTGTAVTLTMYYQVSSGTGSAPAQARIRATWAGGA